MEYVLKESKTLAGKEGTGGDEIRQLLLDLSSRWLKACDEVEKQKKAVRVVPNWYQFRSNLDDIDGWLKKMEQGSDLPLEVKLGNLLLLQLQLLLCYIYIIGYTPKRVGFSWRPFCCVQLDSSGRQMITIFLQRLNLLPVLL